MKNTFKKVILTCTLVLASVVAASSVVAVTTSTKPAISTTEKKRVKKQAKSKREELSKKTNQKDRLKKIEPRGEGKKDNQKKKSKLTSTKPAVSITKKKLVEKQAKNKRGGLSKKTNQKSRLKKIDPRGASKKDNQRKESKPTATPTKPAVWAEENKSKDREPASWDGDKTAKEETTARTVENVPGKTEEAVHSQSMQSTWTDTVPASWDGDKTIKEETTSHTVENVSGKTGEAAHSQPMRGTWIATVYHIDWPQDPKKSSFDAELQKQQFTSMLDKLQASGINAVFVQVRPTSDTLYPSKLLSWSEWLTGTQGEDPGYDPLQFMIEETHKRGMQFHAWVNPFRVSVQGDISKLVDGHPAKAHPEWIVRHLNKLLYNPGVPEARAFILDSIMEMVRNYNIDGVHLDDYFYPYGETKEQPFNDDDTYAKYNDGKLNNKEDWRRNNINEFIKALHEQIKVAKPNVKFGVSPFGVWRNSSADPTGSATNAFSSYDNLYADCRAWIKNKWIDYIAPQIYWHIGHERASYDILVDWWVKETAGTGVELYIGHAVYKLADNKEANWDRADVLIKQLEFNEKFGDSITGSIFFSASHLVRNTKQVSDALQQYYGKGNSAVNPEIGSKVSHDSKPVITDKPPSTPESSVVNPEMGSKESHDSKPVITDKPTSMPESSVVNTEMGVKESHDSKTVITDKLPSTPESSAVNSEVGSKASQDSTPIITDKPPSTLAEVTSFSFADNQLRVSLSQNVAPTIFTLNNPNRVVIDFPGAILSDELYKNYRFERGKQGKHEVPEHLNVERIRFAMFQSTTVRFVIDVREEMQSQITLNDQGLTTIAISPVKDSNNSVGDGIVTNPVKDIPVTPGSQPSTSGSSVVNTEIGAKESHDSKPGIPDNPPSTLTAVTGFSFADNQLRVRLSQNVAPVISTLDNPNRVVIDFPGTVFSDELYERYRFERSSQGEHKVANHSNVEGIRFTMNTPNTVRFEIDVKEAMQGQITLNTQGLTTIAVVPMPDSSTSGGSDTVNPQGKEKYTVVIDAGHGGKDPGARSFKGENEEDEKYEKDFTLALALKIRDLLAQEDKINVVMTRDDDWYLTLSERSSLANIMGADLFLAIHGNSFTNDSVTGTETFYYHLNRKAFADMMHQHLLKGTQFRDRGVKYANFHVVRETNMPSALLEIGFLTNKDDKPKLFDDQFQWDVARNIVKGIKEYLGIL